MWRRKVQLPCSDQFKYIDSVGVVLSSILTISTPFLNWVKWNERWLWLLLGQRQYIDELCCQHHVFLTESWVTTNLRQRVWPLLKKNLQIVPSDLAQVQITEQNIRVGAFLCFFGRFVLSFQLCSSIFSFFKKKWLKSFHLVSINMIDQVVLAEGRPELILLRSVPGHKDSPWEGRCNCKSSRGLVAVR